MTQINHAIGAEGYVSFECKNIVHNYGDSIWEFLTYGVCSLSFPHSNTVIIFIYSSIGILTILLHIFLWLQLRPEIICVDIGLCSRNRSHIMEYNIFHFPLIDSFQIHSFVSSILLTKCITSTCSDVIETVVHNESWGESRTRESPLCTFCDMIVFWIQVQLKQRNTKEKILKYADEVAVMLCSRLHLGIILFTLGGVFNH